MPKYFDLSAIAKELPDYAHSGDPPYSEVYARAMLAELDGNRSYTRLAAFDGDRSAGPKQFTDVEHVVNCFNDALAGILHGLALRVAPGQMKDVVEHLMQHAAFTMRWKAQL